MLSDPQKRAAYDQYGHAGVDPATAAASAQDFGGFAEAFGDIFGDIFGQTGGGGAAGGRGGHGGPQGYRGAGPRYKMGSLVEAASAGYNTAICRAGWGEWG